MTTETVQYVKASDYAAGVAAGAVVSGPTGDGFVHVSFFREVQYPVQQDVDVTTLSISPIRAEKRSDKGFPILRSEKELVATISVPLAAVAQLGESLTKLAEQAKQLPKSQEQ